MLLIMLLLICMIIIIIMYMATCLFFLRKIHQLEARLYKFQSYFSVLYDWLWLKNHGGKLADALLERGWRRIAIYGMGKLGECLCGELEGTGCEIVYCVDQGSKIKKIPCFSPQEELPDADVMIVTACFDYNNVAASLSGRIAFPVISIEVLA